MEYLYNLDCIRLELSNPIFFQPGVITLLWLSIISLLQTQNCLVELNNTPQMGNESVEVSSHLDTTPPPPRLCKRKLWTPVSKRTGV